MSKTFLFIDHYSIWQDPHAPAGTLKVAPMIDIPFWQGIKLLCQPWKYYLHQTMGRPIIMRWRKSND